MNMAVSMYIKSQSKVRNFLYLTRRDFRKHIKSLKFTSPKISGYCKEVSHSQIIC